MFIMLFCFILAQFIARTDARTDIPSHTQRCENSSDKAKTPTYYAFGMEGRIRFRAMTSQAEERLTHVTKHATGGNISKTATSQYRIFKL